MIYYYFLNTDKEKIMRLWFVSFSIISTAFIALVVTIGPDHFLDPFFRISLLGIVSFLYIRFEILRKKYLLKKDLFAEETDSTESYQGRDDSFETSAFILRVFYIGLMLNGGIVICFDYLTIVSFPQLDVTINLLPISFLLTVLLVFILLWWIYRYFGGSSYLHAVLEETLIFGLIGIVLSSWIGAKEINVYCDRTQTLLAPSYVLSKEYHRNGNHISYYLTLSGWNSSREKMLKVNAATYQEFPEGSHLLVYTHKGFLGFPWIEKIAVDPRFITDQ